MGWKEDSHLNEWLSGGLFVGLIVTLITIGYSLAKSFLIPLAILILIFANSKLNKSNLKFTLLIKIVIGVALAFLIYMYLLTIIFYPFVLVMFVVTATLICLVDYKLRNNSYWVRGSISGVIITLQAYALFFINGMSCAFSNDSSKMFVCNSFETIVNSVFFLNTLARNFLSFSSQYVLIPLSFLSVILTCAVVWGIIGLIIDKVKEEK